MPRPKGTWSGKKEKSINLIDLISSLYVYVKYKIKL